MLQIEPVKNYSWLKGNLRYHNLTCSNGEVLGYYESGKIRFRYSLVRDKFHGLCKSWHENGQVSQEELYLNGLLEGVRKEWYPDGALKAEATYHKGLLNGLDRVWHTNGILMSLWTYVNGTRHGPHKEWHDNGNLRLDAPYSNNLINGRLRRYNYEGKLEKSALYVRGVIIKGRVKKLLESGNITAQDIINIRNTALRRICLEELGYERFLSQVEHTIIAKEGEQELIRINWHKREEPLCLVKVKCPSTGAFYTIRVPPESKTIKEAIAWTFGASASEYNPDIET